MKSQTIIIETREPMITTYPHHANLFSILPNDIRSLNWIFHNYLIIFSHSLSPNELGIDLCSHYFPWHQFKWGSCPLIQYQYFNKSTIFSKWNHEEFIWDMLNNGYCIYLFIKRKYSLSNHEVFISGFDVKNNQILVHDFYQGMYQKKWEYLSDFDFYFTEKKVDNEDMQQNIWAIKIGKKYKIPSCWYYESCLVFEKEDFIQILEEYLGKNINLLRIMSKEGRIIGIQVYDEILKYFNFILSSYHNNEDQYIPPHPFLILKEHKELILLAYKTIIKNQNNFVIKNLENLIKITKSIHFSILYLNIANEFKRKIKKTILIIQEVKKLKKKEEIIFNFILQIR